jgi:hypothetical protein
MKFANPQFLWALFSLLVPILIHLFHFRKFKTVFFTNVRFLRELKKETKSRSRLRHILILISRCLALIALVLAFAQPFIPNEFTTEQGDRAISIYIDNSFSMESQGESSSLLELAKMHALEIAKSYKASDRFQLITNELESRQLQWLSREQLAERLEEVKTSSTSRSLDQIILRQQESLKESNKLGVIYMLSDLQKSTTVLAKTKSDSTISVNFVWLKANLSDNISIDSAWFESPYREVNQPDKILFSCTNFSGTRLENSPIKLSIDGIERGLESLSAGADSSFTASISFTTPTKGNHLGQLQINDFPVSFDDNFYFSYEVPDKIRILSINGNESSVYLHQLYSNKPIFTYEEVSDSKVDYSSLPNYNTVILNELQQVSSGLVLELTKFVNQGGSLVILPSISAGAELLKPLTTALTIGEYRAVNSQSQKVGKINLQNPLYDDVFEKKQESIDLPNVIKYFPFTAAGKSAEDVLMRLQNGDLFLTSYSSGKGKVYCSAVPLKEEFGNFPKHAIFIPTFYKIALYSIPPSKLYYTIGNEEPIDLSKSLQSGDIPIKIKSLDGSFEMIPEHRLIDGKMRVFVRNNIQNAGNYRIVQGDSILKVVSFNFNRQESNPETYSAEEFRQKLDNGGWTNASLTDGSSADLPADILLADQGRQLWKLFIILALLFLAIETLLIRFMK